MISEMRKCWMHRLMPLDFGFMALCSSHRRSSNLLSKSQSTFPLQLCCDFRQSGVAVLMRRTMNDMSIVSKFQNGWCLLVQIPKLMPPFLLFAMSTMRPHAPAGMSCLWGHHLTSSPVSMGWIMGSRLLKRQIQLHSATTSWMLMFVRPTSLEK